MAHYRGYETHTDDDDLEDARRRGVALARQSDRPEELPQNVLDLSLASNIVAVAGEYQFGREFLDLMVKPPQRTVVHINRKDCQLEMKATWVSREKHYVVNWDDNVIAMQDKLYAVLRNHDKLSSTNVCTPLRKVAEELARKIIGDLRRTDQSQGLFSRTAIEPVDLVCEFTFKNNRAAEKLDFFISGRVSKERNWLKTNKLMVELKIQVEIRQLHLAIADRHVSAEAGTMCRALEWHCPDAVNFVG